jgi:hypothetical protein
MSRRFLVKAFGALVLFLVFSVTPAAASAVQDCYGCWQHRIPLPDGGAIYGCSSCLGFGSSSGCYQINDCGCAEFFPGGCMMWP